MRWSWSLIVLPIRRFNFEKIQENSHHFTFIKWLDQRHFISFEYLNDGFPHHQRINMVSIKAEIKLHLA